MRKLILTIVLVCPLLLLAKDDTPLNTRCWQMIVNDSQNEVTFCANGTQFTSTTFHPNRKVKEPPTTCSQSGEIISDIKKGNTEIQLSEGMCTNGMAAPIVHLECKIEKTNLVCLYGKEYKLILKPTHNK